jgi:hypothetical protein
MGQLPYFRCCGQDFIVLFSHSHVLYGVHAVSTEPWVRIWLWHRQSGEQPVEMTVDHPALCD